MSVQSTIRHAEQLIHCSAILWIDGRTRARRNGRLLVVASQPLADSFRNAPSCFGVRFRENQHEFVPSVSRSGINFATMNLENIRYAAERATSHKMPVGVIDLLQSVQIEQQHRKGSSGASVSFDFRIKRVEKPPIVSKPGERISDRQLPNVFIRVSVFGNFGGESQGRYGHEAHERLQ